MIIYPAIDLRHGQCVRLYQGDYQQETIYHHDPLQQGANFVAQGADWLHVVDLDAAKDPTQNQSVLIASLVKHCNVNIQTGGGIRSKEQVQHLLDQGISRVIIGSLAVKQPQEIWQWLHEFGAEKIDLAFDIQLNDKEEAMVATDAWQQQSQHSLFDLLEYYQSAGLKHVLCTDIARDGTMQGPNDELYERILTRYPTLHLQASGGIHSISDLKRLSIKKLAGAIIGRALYENKLTVSEALTC